MDKKKTEIRLIDANALLDKCENLYMRGNVLFHGVTACTIENAPTIDPETLPIVQELRERLEQVTQERDAAIEQLHGDCEKCAHYKVTWNGCTPDFECPLSNNCLNRDMWEWRGPQKED